MVLLISDSKVFPFYVNSDKLAEPRLWHKHVVCSLLASSVWRKELFACLIRSYDGTKSVSLISRYSYYSWHI